MLKDTSKLTVVIVSRPDCWKCKDIQELLSNEGVGSTIVVWHDGGAKLLAKYEILPSMLPVTLVFLDGKLQWFASGIAEFLETWEKSKGE